MKTVEATILELRHVYDSWPELKIPIESEHGYFNLKMEDSHKESVMAGIEALNILHRAIPILRNLAKDTENSGIALWASDTLRELPFCEDENQKRESMQRIFNLTLDTEEMLTILAQEVEHPGSFLQTIQNEFRWHVGEWWGTWDDCHVKAEPFQWPSGLKGITITAVLR